MLDKKYFAKVRKELLSYAQKRREVIKISGDAQQLAKKAIFAFQRADTAAGNESLGKSLELLKGVLRAFKSDPDLFDEGAYRAALEEYVEAALFKRCISNEAVGPVEEIEVDEDMYISGLCDVPGELQRYAIRAATVRDFKVVERCYAQAEDIVSELVDMDLTGYHRTKFDQAKQALHRLEQVRYEVSLVASKQS